MSQTTKMIFPEGYVCKHNKKVMAFANMLGRKKAAEPGGKGSYQWDDPEYVILEAGMDDEMADIGLALGFFTKRTAKEVAQIARRDEAYCHAQLERLAHYGGCFVNRVNGEDVYWTPESWIPGTMEIIVNQRENVAKYPIVGYAMEAYGRVRGPKSAGAFPVGVGLMRVIPIERAIDGDSRRVSYEEVSKYLNENDVFSVSDCSCRTDREVMGEGCGHLKDDMCIQMGHAAEYYIRTGRGRAITREEAFAIIRRAEENGLMHQIPNIDGSGKTHAICNCCGCACLSLRTGEMFKNTDMLRANYVAVVDKEKCVACGQCVENCPVNALKLGQKLCSKTPIAEDITTTVTPRDHDWGEEMWNADYRLNRADVVDTGTAPCKTGCPAHIAVQGYIKLAALGRYDEALALIKTENPLPAICGRICNRRCEDACTRGDVDEPIAIDEIKKFIAQRDLAAETRFTPKKRHHYDDKKIAVIGAGPAGLSCAYFLALDGYDVTVFEKEQSPGGMLTLGIPAFRLEKDVVRAEIDVIRQMGVKFETGVDVGRDVTLDALRKRGYKAFYLAIGAGKGRLLGLPGEDAAGVVAAVDFLRAVNRDEGFKISGNVVVIGGGNVAMDAARTAARAGADKVSVYCLESEAEMPANREEREETREDGVTIHPSRGVQEIVSEGGHVKAVAFKRCVTVTRDGAFAPVYDETDVVTEAADHVLLAVGQAADFGGLDLGKAVVRRNNTVEADDWTYQTAQPDIFAGGDVTTGTAFAIDAIAAGKQAAISIHRFAQNGQDLRFGRSRRAFSQLDKTAAVIDNYDNTPRQRPGRKGDHTPDAAFRDLRDVFTEEQLKRETERCLSCGATVADSYMCVGCGQCVTQCRFDAIKLERRYDGEGVEMLKMKPVVLKQMIKRKVKITARKVHSAVAGKR